MDAHDRLVTSLRAALDARPEDVTLRLHLAQILLDSGDLPGAMSEAAEALRYDPSCDQARDFMVTALERRPSGAETGNAEAEAVAEPRLPRTDAPLEVPPKERFDWTAAESDVAGLVGPRFADEPAGANPDTYETETPGLRLADIGGMEDVKDRLEVAFLAPMRNPELRALYGTSLRGGLLLYGPPGCGKTFLARAVAGELGASFIVVGISDVLDLYFGQSERNLRELFAQARRKAPCVLFLDEVDALGQKRSQSRGSGMRTVVNQLLEEMDGVAADNEGLFILGATNQPWDVDTALRRPGRFDRTVLVLPPDPTARRSILEFHLRNRPVENIDLTSLVARTDGFSGADLGHLCDTAAEQALIASSRSGTVRMIGMADFETALRQVRPSTGPWFDAAKGVAMFANEGGAYDDLLSYLKQQRMM
ncbi:AAA family ATPase [Nonomuraea sp. NPDC052129]|uniref:ATP-binding protein n=1 Tax=Nonomuraea sp. NPDC052129 TaxID=3154651 RepID=UPI003421869D